MNITEQEAREALRILKYLSLNGAESGTSDLNERGKSLLLLSTLIDSLQASQKELIEACGPIIEEYEYNLEMGREFEAGVRMKKLHTFVKAIEKVKEEVD